MTESNSQVNQSLDPNSPLYHSLDLLKIGHSMLTGAMIKTPTGAAIAITNDAILNIGISATAQDKSLGKSTIEFIGGFAAGTVCTISGGFLSGPFAAAGCGYIGSELSGRLYDEIAKVNNYDNFEDFRQDYYQNNTAPTFEETLDRHKVLETLQNGDYAYVNSPLHGGKLFTKVNGELHEVEGPITQPDTSVIDSFNVDSREVQVYMGDQGNLNFKVTTNDSACFIETDKPLTEAEKIATIESIIPFAKPTNYTIQSGDTLSQIADNNGVTIERLLELNPSITDANIINAGDQIVVNGSIKEVSVNSEDFTVLDIDPLAKIKSQLGKDTEFAEGSLITGEDGSGEITYFLSKEAKALTKDGGSYEVISLLDSIDNGLAKIGGFFHKQVFILFFKGRICGLFYYYMDNKLSLTHNK